MAWLIPYVINGAKHPATLFRRQAQRPASEVTGVAQPGDLKVTQLPAAADGIRIMPGGMSLVSRYPNRARESYGVENDAAVDVTGLEGTGSSARSDAVVFEVLDPNYLAIDHATAALTNYMKVHVVQGVSATATTIANVPGFSGRTAYMAARIDWPANQTSVQGSYIKDMRKLARPRRESQPISFSLVDGQQETLSSVALLGEVWPNAFTNSTERANIPEWATHVDIRLLHLGVTAPVSSVTVATWVQIGGNTGAPEPNADILTQKTTLRANPMLGVADRRPIPAAMRGLTHRVYPMARMLGASAPPVASRPSLDAQSSMQIELNYLQLAV